jgi:hypothetical protein
MKKNFFIVKHCFLMIVCALFLQTCTYNHLPESNSKVLLNWYPAPANQTQDEYTTGMVWLFSYLGAKLPSNKFDKGILFISSNKIEIDFEKLGFADFALNHLKNINSKIKETEEYRATGGVDAGRFFALIFNSTYHYYKITGAPASYNEFSAKYANLAYKTFVCDTSAISISSRVFNYSINDFNLQKNVFISEEGNGIYSSGAFQKSGIIEAFDYMENGQPRFVIYNAKGNLYVPSEPSVHRAGKPAKCMWCHESGMQPLFVETPNLTGSVSTFDFLGDQQLFTEKLEKFHENTASRLNFSDKKAHAQGEYIYLCFYEPNANRLAQEWNLSVTEVKRILTGISTHTNPEFPFLKEVYYRSQVQSFAPYSSIEVSNEMREATSIEPNYLN